MTNTYENEEFNKKTHHIKNIFFIPVLSNIKKTQPSEGRERGTVPGTYFSKKRNDQSSELQCVLR
jgi:hypothetical protein